MAEVVPVRDCEVAEADLNTATRVLVRRMQLAWQAALAAITALMNPIVRNRCPIQ